MQQSLVTELCKNVDKYNIYVKLFILHNVFK